MSVPTVARGAEIAIVPSAVPRTTCSAWLALIDAAYRGSDVHRTSAFVPESSSFRLHAIADLSVDAVWSALSGPVREFCEGVLGARLTIDADQCWVRRQFPPSSTPPRHSPHSWHQDGALGFDFAGSGAAIPDDALLRMVTCWIALSPCGVDGPGLELVTERVDHLLSPMHLTESAIEQRWPTSRRARPVLAVGDAVIFTGDVLHRTHVSAAMSEARTSIELRCFPSDAIPRSTCGF